MFRTDTTTICEVDTTGNGTPAWLEKEKKMKKSRLIPRNMENCLENWCHGVGPSSVFFTHKYLHPSGHNVLKHWADREIDRQPDTQRAQQATNQQTKIRTWIHLVKKSEEEERSLSATRITNSPRSLSYPLHFLTVKVARSGYHQVFKDFPHELPCEWNVFTRVAFYIYYWFWLHISRGISQMDMQAKQHQYLKLWQRTIHGTGLQLTKESFPPLSSRDNRRIALCD